jgi:hypothetical protein
VGCAPSTDRVAADRHGMERNRSSHPVKYPELHNRDALLRLTHRGLDADGVAAAIGWSRRTALDALRRHGIYTRPRRPSPPARRLRTDLRLFRNVNALARAHGVTPKTARRWLSEGGVLNGRAARALIGTFDEPWNDRS